MAKILIVEDERSIRQALRFELEDQGYEVGDAADYSEALSAIRAFDYDLVISDIYLNNGDAVQLIRNAYEDKKDVPFIGMTAFPSSELAQKAKLILKDRFFEKPFLASAIKEKVDEVLSVSTS
ncbi:MAG: response regulator [Calditrichia bacterium]|jgi:DNA-binding NtrC family response regulator|nr:response regulator [Calditrichia bacterium]